MMKRRSTVKAKKTKKAKRATKVTAAVALKALARAGANYKHVGSGKINVADIHKFMEELKKKKIPLHRIKFVALNAPFMRRPPTPAA